MQFVITSVRENHFRSTSVASAADGVEMLDASIKDGYTVVLILDRTYQKISQGRLRALAADELVSQQLD